MAYKNFFCIFSKKYFGHIDIYVQNAIMLA